ncbi:hypothetical protein [Demequina iriomotensis]|uniref:hypothetical protein n=1 Tax=Demequina iriomotensis TaxID=1536641 RepID=UPI000782C1F0|nr:hypothetical protein [Demequina iriomotensis]
MRGSTGEDRDIDRLLRGDAPAALADAVPAIEALRRLAPGAAQADAARIGIALATVAADSRIPLSRESAATGGRWRSRTASAGALALLIGGVAAGAAAADPAAPGDPLYEIDLAFERLGICRGGPAERLAESLRLDGRGDLGSAVEHAAGVAEVDADASEELLAAARRLRADASETSEEVRASVKDLLDWMAEADFSAPDFSVEDFDSGVIERARRIPAPKVDAPAADDDVAPAPVAEEPRTWSRAEDRAEPPDPVAPPQADGVAPEDAAEAPAAWKPDGEAWRQGADGWDGGWSGGDAQDWDGRWEGSRTSRTSGGVGASPMPDHQSGSDQAFSPNQP